jgi:phosphohistidine phosphatase
MKLYFLRHAAALDGDDDAKRPLSPQGRRQSRKLARFLKRAGVVFDAAYSSPLVRARQTGEIVIDITNESAPVKLELVEALLNSTTEPDFEKWAAGFGTFKHVLLVGHEPAMSARVRKLLGVERFGTLELAKGAMACVKVEGKSATLKFLIAPKALGLGNG